LGNGYSWEILFIPIEVFDNWFEKCLYRISKGDGLVLVGFKFTKCYIDDIIVFNPISRDHQNRLKEVFGRLKNHNLKFHLGKCWLFYTRVEYLGHMIYPGGLGVQKTKVEAIS
jgi:hypothetical protein